MTEKDLEELTFEEAIKKLEATLEKMEKEELTLEDSINSFQEGMKLTQHCKNILSKAEQKIEMLMDDGTMEEYRVDE